MESIAKIGIILALIGGIFSGIFAFLFKTGRYDTTKADLSVTKTNLEQTTNKLNQTESELSATKQNLEATTTQLSEARSKAESLTQSLNEATEKLSSLEKELVQTKEKMALAEAKLAEVNRTLGEKSEEARAATEKLEALQAERKIIDEQLAAAQKEINRLNDLIRRKPDKKLPPGISGRIVNVNKNWGFVVLNIGDKDGLIPGGELIVYRGKEYIGKLRVTSTEAKTAVADIIPDATRGEIQIGDEVFN
ncbi:MAG: hypothetical protein NZM04_10640 [Methylacidiphilales bacterium]|nr:hypothetical protein [Candidatus Methylacidiphilales bacterium]MDW8349080.1 hypothetical protein [Verrucomicrobiae bacterium]